MNIEIGYMYRDASNYKKHGSVILVNPKMLPAETVLSALRNILSGLSGWSDILVFRPEWVGLKCVFLFDEEFERNEDDHDWHEINFVTETSEDADDPAGRTINQFLKDIRRTHKRSNAYPVR